MEKKVWNALGMDLNAGTQRKARRMAKQFVKTKAAKVCFLSCLKRVLPHGLNMFFSHVEEGIVSWIEYFFLLYLKRVSLQELYQCQEGSSP